MDSKDFDVASSASERAPPSEIIDAMRLSLGRYGEADGWAIEMISAKGKPGRERRVFRAHHERAGWTLAIKSSANRADNRRRYRALRRLSARTADCVTPLYVDDTVGFFVMEWVDAPLLEARLAGPERRQAIRQAGEWLARLHAATRRQPLLGTGLHVMRRPHENDGTDLGAAAARLRARLERLSRRSGPIATLHGDFQPGNLFDADDRLLAFDGSIDRDGTVFLDVATFLLGVVGTGQLEQPLSDDAEADRRSFFEGYGPIRERDLAFHDLIEDAVYFRRWSRCRSRGDPGFDDQMRIRGLLGANAPRRPGRLVLDAQGGVRWCGEAAPAAPRGLLRRAFRRIGQKG